MVAPAAPDTPAEQVTGRPFLSHSEITSVRTCPRRFAFRHVENARPEFLPGSLAFGAAIHAALGLHLRGRLEGVAVTADGMLSAYSGEWDRRRAEAGPGVPVRFNAGEDEDTLLALAARVIASFLQSPLARPGGTILCVGEERRVGLGVGLGVGLPDLAATVDLAYEADDALYVVDFRTSRGRWNQARAGEEADSLLLHALAVYPIAEELGVPVRPRFAVLTKAKKPLVQVIDVPAGPERLELAKQSVAGAWGVIRSGRYDPQPSPRHCTACPYRGLCFAAWHPKRNK